MDRCGGATGVQPSGGGEFGVSVHSDFGRMVIADRPSGRDDMAVTGELHGGGEVNRLVRQPHTADGGLAGGKEGQLGGRKLFGSKLQDGEGTVGEVNRATARIHEVLTPMAGE